MSNKKDYTRIERLERLELSNKPTLIVSASLENKIKWLHDKEGNKEWSGELITSEDGNITDLDKWTIRAEDMFLVDIGTAGGTEYEVGRGAFKSADVVELYEAYPALLEGNLKLQHIHTHFN